MGSVGNGAGNKLTINRISATATGLAVATIAYVNGESTQRTAVMTVNGQVPTIVAFPSTGSWSKPGTVSVVVSLRKGSGNSITFGNSAAWAPDLDAVAIAPLPGTFGTEVVGKQSTRCLDIFNNSTADETQAELWDCAGGTNQNWAYTSAKELVVYGTRCLDNWGHGTSDGTKPALYSCTGGNNQKWNVNSDGTISNVESGLCGIAGDGTSVTGCSGSGAHTGAFVYA